MSQTVCDGGVAHATCDSSAAGHTPSITVSVVSHGHDDDIARLLQEIARTAPGRIARVIVIHNLKPARPLDCWPSHEGVVEVVHQINRTPQGFARNHNHAFSFCETPFFCVLNPDVHGIRATLWDALTHAAAQPGVACAYPELRNPDGSLQDSQRALLTPFGLWRRRVWGEREIQTDWVSAACWLVPAHVWRSVGGFDEGFRMYVEDAQWCLRAQLAGLRLVQAPVALMHVGQRASRRRWRHLAWHLSSLLRLWGQPVFYAYLQARRARLRQ